MRAINQARQAEETGEALLDAGERERALRALDALLEDDETELDLLLADHHAGHGESGRALG